MDGDSLDRFLVAQASMYQTALQEIQRGEKDSHWIWYIFPQLRGLGHSTQAFIYGIRGREEAKAYLNHPVLSARLVEITEALLTHKGKNIIEIMGSHIDGIKLRSSMTLFALISEEGSIFHQVLDCFYHGKMDRKTVERLESEA